MRHCGNFNMGTETSVVSAWHLTIQRKDEKRSPNLDANKGGKQTDHQRSRTKQEERSSLFLWQLQPRNLALIQKHGAELVGGSENKHPRRPCLSTSTALPSGLASAQRDAHTCMVLVCLDPKEGRLECNKWKNSSCSSFCAPSLQLPDI